MATISASYIRPGQALTLLALLATWALVQIGFASFRDLGLSDPDSYMRLVRIRELMEGEGWFDSVIARANAPYGDRLHWTRPFDVLVLMIALPAGIIVESERALYLAGFFVSPLLQLTAALLLGWTLRPVVRPQVWLLPAIALLIQPAVLAYSLTGRADHHSLLLLVFIVVAGFMLRGLRTPHDNGAPLAAGLAAGFGIWVSVEFLLVIGLCLAALGLAWLAGERERAAQSKWFCLAMSIVILMALVTERPLDSVLHPSYDRVSSVHFVFAVSVLLFWRLVETVGARTGWDSRIFQRTALGVVGIGVATLFLASLHPLFFTGPMAEVDPRIVPIWLDRVLEMRPLVLSDQASIGRFVLFLGGVLLVALPLLKLLVEEWGSRSFFCFLFLAMGCLLLSVVAARHMRFAGYAEASFVMAFALVLDRFLISTTRLGSDLLRGLLRGGFISLMLLGPLLIGGSLIAKSGDGDDATAARPNGCPVSDLASYLEADPRWNARPQTVLAFMDIGPELLYRTRHRVVGTPYHRNGDGIFDGYSMLATSDLTAARSMFEQRGVDLVLLCRSPAERAFYTQSDGKDNLYTSLDRNEPPDWLEAVELPPDLRDQARLYRTLR